MGFGKGNNSFGPNAKLYSFTIKTKDLPSPVFVVSKKEGDEYVDLPETANRVDGSLIGAQIKKNEYQGKTIKSLNLTLKDGDDVYFVSVGYTFLGRNLFNSLLNLQTFDNIEINLYQSKPKPDAKDKRGFPSVALRQKGGLIKGKFDKTELPKTNKVRINGTDQTDTEEIDLFFENHLTEFCKLVRAQNSNLDNTNSTEPKSIVEQEHTSSSTPEDEVIPF